MGNLLEIFKSSFWNYKENYKKVYLFLFLIGQNFCPFILKGGTKGEKSYKIRFWQIFFYLTGGYRNLYNSKPHNLQRTSRQILLAQWIKLRRVKHEIHVGENEKKKKYTQFDWVNRSAKRDLGNKRFIRGWWSNSEMDLTKKKLSVYKLDSEDSRQDQMTSYGTRGNNPCFF